MGMVGFVGAFFFAVLTGIVAVRGLDRASFKVADRPSSPPTSVRRHHSERPRSAVAQGHAGYKEPDLEAALRDKSFPECGACE